MATKKTYGSARAFTEGHLEVIGDQSEKANPSPAPLSAKQLASYAMQRKQNAKPFAERNTGANFDRHAQDQSFKARLSRWEEKEANRGNQVHGFGPKPVDLGRIVVVMNISHIIIKCKVILHSVGYKELGLKTE